jgi:predicted nuclease of restriction endonuclease-like RecB superfamily
MTKKYIEVDGNLFKIGFNEEFDAYNEENRKFIHVVAVSLDAALEIARSILVDYEDNMDIMECKEITSVVRAQEECINPDRTFDY